MNRFSSSKKTMRTAAIFLVMALGLWSFTACSDSVEDLVKGIVDIDFDKDAEIKLDDVTTEKTATVNALAAGDDCGTMSVSTGLAALESQIEDLDIVDIESVTLEYVNAEYTASWTPAAITTLTCKLTITGTQSTEFEETAINSASGSVQFTLTPEQTDVVNYYLANRNETFDYCLVCDNDDLIETYSVTYSIDIGVNIVGNI